MHRACGTVQKCLHLATYPLQETFYGLHPPTWRLAPAPVRGIRYAVCVAADRRARARIEFRAWAIGSPDVHPESVRLSEKAKFPLRCGLIVQQNGQASQSTNRVR